MGSGAPKGFWDGELFKCHVWSWCLPAGLCHWSSSLGPGDLPLSREMLFPFGLCLDGPELDEGGETITVLETGTGQIWKEEEETAMDAAPSTSVTGVRNAVAARKQPCERVPYSSL